jgi:methylglutaconyl-CoA hydratase
VARVTIDRPEQRNALSTEVIDGLAAAFGGFATEPANVLRAVVLGGEGKAFCAGADVAWMRLATTMTRDENEAQAATLGRLFLAIDACPVPVVARVQGPALGGGAGLLCVADVVIAEAGAVTGFPEVRLGLAAATIAPYVVRRIGEGQARTLFTTGVRIDALEAQRVGLVNWVVDDTDALDAAVDEAIAGILTGAPEAVRAAKALVRDLALGHAGPATRYPEAMASRLADRRASPEAAEGLAAFLERRRPSWAPGEDA